MLKPVIFTSLLVAAALAQSEVHLSGTAKDENASPLKGVVVKLGRDIQDTSDAEGNWSLGGTRTSVQRSIAQGMRFGHGVLRIPRRSQSATRVDVYSMEGKRLTTSRMRVVGDEEEAVLDLASTGARLVVVRLSDGEGSRSFRVLNPFGLVSSDPPARAHRSVSATGSVSDTIVSYYKGVYAGSIPLTKYDSAGIALSIKAGDLPYWNQSIAYGKLVDPRDLQEYRTVTISTQTWMAENLNYASRSSRTYNNSIENGRKYGRLYPWFEAVQVDSTCASKICADKVLLPRQGVCPTGWHLPSGEDWTKLQAVVDTLGGISGKAGTNLRSMKGWGSSNTALDPYGFRGILAGALMDRSGYSLAGDNGIWWSASERNATTATAYEIYYGPSASTKQYLKANAHSIRCIKD